MPQAHQPVAATLLGLAVLLALAPGSSAAQILISKGTAFESAAEIHIQAADDDATRAAFNAAWQEIGEIEALTDPEVKTSQVAQLNAHAGEGPLAIDQRLLDLLGRSLAFCLWSEGRWGPTAGQLYAIWGLHRPVAGIPHPDDVAAAAAASRCDRLVLDPEASSATLGAGVLVDLWGFEVGYAVDRAIEELREQGFDDALVTIGGISRAIGPGPAGDGWPVVLEGRPAVPWGPRPFVLADASLATVRKLPALQVPGTVVGPWLDHRTGAPAKGVLVVFATTDLALDAEALAAAMFVTGSRTGAMLAGQLRPRPGVLWLLGTGRGEPLVTDYQWHAVTRR